MALQFHPEVKAANIDRWLIGHACELSEPSMPDLHFLRSEALKYGPDLQRHAMMRIGQWLSDVGLVGPMVGEKPILDQGSMKKLSNQYLSRCLMAEVIACIAEGMKIRLTGAANFLSVDPLIHRKNQLSL